MPPQNVLGFINQVLQAAGEPANKAHLPHYAALLVNLVQFYLGLLAGFPGDGPTGPGA